MNVLTSQYPLLQVRKFSVSYTDFQPSGASFFYKLLQQEKKRCFIFLAQIKHSTIFQSTAMNTITLHLGDENYKNDGPGACNSFTSLIVSSAPADTNGSASGLQLTSRYDGVLGNSIILPYDNVSKLYACLEIAGGETMNDILSGVAEIWYGYMFLK